MTFLPSVAAVAEVLGSAEVVAAAACVTCRISLCLVVQSLLCRLVRAVSGEHWQAMERLCGRPPPQVRRLLSGPSVRLEGVAVLRGILTLRDQVDLVEEQDEDRLPVLVMIRALLLRRDLTAAMHSPPVGPPTQRVVVAERVKQVSRSRARIFPAPAEQVELQQLRVLPWSMAVVAVVVFTGTTRVRHLFQD